MTTERLQERLLELEAEKASILRILYRVEGAMTVLQQLIAEASAIAVDKGGDAQDDGSN